MIDSFWLIGATLAIAVLNVAVTVANARFMRRLVTTCMACGRSLPGGGWCAQCLADGEIRNAKEGNK